MLGNNGIIQSAKEKDIYNLYSKPSQIITQL